MLTFSRIQHFYRSFKVSSAKDDREGVEEMNSCRSDMMYHQTAIIYL